MITVLLIEDEPSKANVIKSLLMNQLKIAESSILIASTAMEAIDYMRNRQFSSIILDLCIPFNSGGESKLEYGIAVWDFIQEPDNSIPSHCVSIMTQHLNIYEEVGDRFIRTPARLIYWDYPTDKWESDISAKVAYDIACQAGHRPKFNFDLAVITALNLPEFSALLENGWVWEPLDFDHDPVRYFKTELRLRDGRDFNIIAAHAPRMGNSTTAALAARMIEVFRPKYLCMTGIAAGTKSNHNLGDVISVEVTYDWSAGKYASDSGESFFIHSPQQFTLDTDIKYKIDYFIRKIELFNNICNNYTPFRPPTELQMFSGVVASGPAVLADKTTREMIQQQHHRLTAIEMETFGLFAAANDASHPKPITFAFKSICDKADASKDDKWQHYASYTSAMALRAFIEECLL